MRKRVLSLLMTLLLCFSMLPTAVSAAEDEVAAQPVDALASTGHADHKYCGSTDCDHDSEGSFQYATPIGDAAGLLQLANAGGCYYLTDNIYLDSTWEPKDGTVLCLNGKTIRANGEGAAISVAQGRTFTLLDCQGTGILRHGDKKGQGVRVAGKLYMYGGKITNCNGVNASRENAGGVEVTSGGKFYMLGGKITKNSVVYASGAIQFAGGVYIANNGSLTLARGAEITDNKDSDIYLCSGMKIGISEPLTGSSESEVNTQVYPDLGETIEIGYPTGTDVGEHFDPAYTTCTINARATDNVLLLTRKSGWLRNTVSSKTLTLTEGKTAAVSVSATYEEGGTVKADHLGYQWYENTKAGDTPIDGATNATFNVPTDLAPGTYYYYCRAYAYNAAGGWIVDPSYSSIVTVTVLGNLTVRKGADVTQPYGTEDGKVTLNITGADGYTLSYQWYEADSEDRTKDRLIPGATNAEYPIPADTLIGEYYYYCVAMAAESGERFETSPSKVTITKGTAVSDNLVIKTIPVYYNTATMYTCDLKDALPDGVVLSSASYTIDGDIYCDSDWIEKDSVQLSGSVLTFNSKSASDPKDEDVLRLTIKVTSKNYEDFYIMLTGKASQKREEKLATARVNWTYGETPVDPRTEVIGVPADAVWVRTTYMDLSGKAIDAPTNAGNYKYKVEYKSVSTHYVAEGLLDIDRIQVDKSWVTITNAHTTYDGTTKYAWEVIKVTVNVNGQKIPLSSDDFHTSGVTAAADASATPKRGQLTLQGNYQLQGNDGIDFTWYIDPLEAELELVKADGRKYGDGKGNVTLRVKNATEHSPVTVTCDGGDDLSVGDHDITATALLNADGTANTNYKLPESRSERTLTYHVAKGDAPAEKRLSMDVYNNTTKTYTYDFTKELPTDLTLGNYSYSGLLGSRETNWIVDENRDVSFQNGVLSFTTGKWTSESDNFVLWYEVTVTSDNYEDFKLYLAAYPKDKPQFPVPASDITMAGWTYGQNPTTPSVAGLPAGVTPTFTYASRDGQIDYGATPPTDAGDYAVTVRAETDDIVYIGTKPFTVAPKVLTADDIREYGPISPNKVYDGKTGFDLTGLGTKKTSLVGTPGANDVLYIGGTSEFASANAGDTELIFTTNGKLGTFTGSAVKPGNYTIAKGLTKSYPARIDQRPIAFTVDSVSKRFGSSDSTADVRVTFTSVSGNNKSGLVDGEQLTQGVDYDVTAQFRRTDFGTDNNVTVTVTLKDTAKARNYTLSNPTLTGVTGEIKKAAAPNVPEQTVEIYSNAVTQYPIDLKKGWPAGTPSIFDYTYDGRDDPEWDTGEISDQLYQSASFTCPAPDDWNGTGTIYLNINRAFTADVGADLGVLKLTFKSPNYDDVTLCIRFKVKAKAQKTLAVNLEGWRYGETANPPAYTVPASATETTLTYTSRDGQTSYGATPPTDAGDYTLTVRCEGIDTIWTGSEDFTIARKPIAPPAADTTSFTYTSSAQTYTLASNAAYTISPNTTQTNAGSYTITVSLNDTANTEWTDGTMAAKEYTFTISAAKLTVTALDKRITAGQSAPDLTTPVLGEDYKVDGLLGQDALTAVTLTYGETPDTRKAGSYAINISAVQTNYDITTVPSTLTVAPRPSSGGGSTTYPVNTPSKTENGSVSVSPKNASRGDTVTITVKPDDGYVLDDLAVTDKNGNDLKLTDKGNGKYTFTMPAGKVEVKASFAEETETSPFADVATDAYYYEAVKWAAEQGITGGIGNNLFGSNQPCTRAQIVTFLWRAAGSPEPKAMSSFTDIPADSYYAKAVAWAVENGITTGTGDGKFSPDATCTRAQAVTFLFRASEASGAGVPAFSDVSANAYYAEAVKWATDNGITNGIGGNLFGSNNDCTRAQIVTFLWRLYTGE